MLLIVRQKVNEKNILLIEIAFCALGGIILKNNLEAIKPWWFLI